mmetsp:Transcript_19271/g.53341  ORF Transcript_19271/g.53341 Transcript_19271/m.53341 type:complete len:358 (+) Transcript_19271:2-1075(+)
MPLDRQEEIFLMEYTQGTTDVAAADATVCVNKAIGGAEIGHWAISLDAAAEVYLLDMKATTGYHEGSIGVGVQRDGWLNRDDLFQGWACGTGHTIGNKLTYNAELGTWARLCWTDNNVRNAAEPDGPYAGTYLFAWFFQTLGSSEPTSPIQISALPTAMYSQDSPGGPHSIIGLGADGWMAVGFGPVGLDKVTAQQEVGTSVSIDELQLAVSISVLPASSTECGGSPADDDKCNWNFLTSLPGHSLWNYDGENGGLGYVNVQQMSRDDEFLVGYATKINHQNTDALSLTYRLAKISKDGTVHQVKVLDNVAWGEDDTWARLSNGCVAFPFVGTATPGGPYSTSDAGADQMRITVICD